jgi:hypothetical protein
MFWIWVVLQSCESLLPAFIFIHPLWVTVLHTRNRFLRQRIVLVVQLT